MAWQKRFFVEFCVIVGFIVLFVWRGCLRNNRERAGEYRSVYGYLSEKLSIETERIGREQGRINIARE